MKTCRDLDNSLLDDDGPVSSGYDTYDSTAIASAMNGTPGMKRIDENWFIFFLRKNVAKDDIAHLKILKNWHLDFSFFDKMSCPIPWDLPINYKFFGIFM